MPKKGKNKGKVSGRNHRTSNFTVDTTLRLDDCANSAETGNVSSRKFNSIPKVLEAVKAELETSRDDRDWFDKELEDYGDQDVNSSNSNLEDAAKIEKSIDATLPTRPAKLNPQMSDNGAEGGNIYPSDIYRILSDYVRPEDVGRFAGICRDTYNITCTSRFWIRMYNRYYRYVKELPNQLEANHVAVKHEGLKTAIVRSLYYFYGPFIQKKRLNLNHDADRLIMTKCALLWHEKGKHLHTYYFKMEEPKSAEEPALEDVLNSLKKSQETHRKNVLGNVLANSEKRYKVLEITSANFVSIPPSVIGDTLVSVGCGLSADLRGQNISLVFGPPHSKQHYRNGKGRMPITLDGCKEITITSVVGINVLNWWNPTYPCISAEAVLCAHRGKDKVKIAHPRQSDLYF